MIVKDAICFGNTSGRSSRRRRRTRRSRSHAQSAGRAAARPQSKLRCGGGGRATFGSGGARKYGCDQTGCGGLSVVEQPASLIGALNSPLDKSPDERQGPETKPISRGTESSNPVPSSSESSANRPSLCSSGDNFAARESSALRSAIRMTSSPAKIRAGAVPCPERHPSSCGRFAGTSPGQDRSAGHRVAEHPLTLPKRVNLFFRSRMKAGIGRQVAYCDY